jgi:DNA-binding NarL/FixJ family response regulator
MENQNKIGIMIYEDKTDLLYTLSKVIDSHNGFKLLGAFPNANNVLKEVELHRPDVILMDIDMPGTSGKTALREIKSHYPDIDIIMLTVFDDNENIFECIQAGASGYLLKSTSHAKIIEAIKDVKEGGAPMTSQVAKKVLQLLPRTSVETKETTHLTSREVEVLSFLTKGYSYKMIAQELNISIDTVRHFIKIIYKKLHVNSMTGAVSKAIKDRLV